MREILFRGKRKDNGEWVEGYYVCVGGKYHYILTGQIDLMSGYPRFIYCEVIPEAVGQYTGLTDKNGKKIFEDDDVTAGCNVAGVKYNESKAAFYIEDENCEEYLGEEWGTDIEIIGNIHDNPELVKGE